MLGFELFHDTVLDTLILRGLAATLEGCRGRRSLAIFIAAAHDGYLQERPALVLNAGLFGQPSRRFLGQRCNGPAICGVLLNVQAIHSRIIKKMRANSQGLYE